MKIFTQYNLGLLLLRVSFSGMLLTHGVPKLIKLLTGDHVFKDPIGLGAPVALSLAVFGEVVFPVLIILGYKTRWATIPVMATMIIAAFVVHANDPFAVKEMAVLYFIAFLSIMVLGPGKYSLEGR